MPRRRERGRSIFFRRTLAYVADCVLLFFVLAPLGFGLQQLFDVTPSSSHAIYATLLLNFSVPVWVYFVWGDQSAHGATLGKRLLALRTETATRERIGVGRALGRTGVKMIPWEATHISAFLLAPTPGEFGAASWSALSLAYALAFVYVGVAWFTEGRRSVHDLLAGTSVGVAAASPTVPQAEQVNHR